MTFVISPPPDMTVQVHAIVAPMVWRLPVTAAALYVVGALAGYAFMLRPAGMVVVWPPAGLLLGLLLIHDRRSWPLLLAGGLVGNAVADLWQGSAISTVFLAALANNGEAWFCAWVITTITGARPTLRSLRHVGALIVGSVLVANALSSIFGALVLMHGSGMSFWTGWYVWWTGDGLGQLLFAPLVLTLANARSEWRGRVLEGVFLLAVVALVAWGVTTDEPQAGQALTMSPYLVFPFLLLASIRLGPSGAALANVVLASVILWFGSSATGLFGRDGYSATDQVLQAWSFIGVAAASSLAISAVLAERFDAEARLRRSEDRLNQIGQNISEVVWIAEAGLQRLEYVSWAFERIWGRSADDLYRTPRLFFQSLHPEDRARVRAVFRTARTGPPATFTHEYRIVRPDGEVRWIADRGYPLPRKGDELQLYVGIARDVTERHQAQARLEMLAQALESTNELVSVTDLEDRFTFVNQAFLRTYGYDMADVIGQTPALLLRSGGDAEMSTLIVEASRTTGWNGIIQNYRRDGTELTIELNTSPVRTSTGELVALLGVGRDITTRLALEADLRQAQKMEAVGQLAGGVAHDFNNLLTVILGYTRMLLDDAPTPAGWRTDIGEIHAAATRAAQLTRQLLTFSRRQPLSPRTIDLAETIVGVMPLIRRLIGEDIRVTFTRDDGPMTVCADPVQAEQVIINLCVNARDAMPDGGDLTLAVARGETSGRPRVMLRVQDSGTGMDLVVQRRIFEPFFTTKPTGKGTGLGLSTVFGIVKGLEGTIDVVSAPGAGTTFMIGLPADDEHAEAVEPVRSAATRGGHETVLVVEDELAIRQLVGQVLESCGYTVLSAGSPSEALEALKEDAHPFDLLITDIRLPGGRGISLAATFRETLPALRVLFISGYSDTRPDPADHYLAKPFDGPALARAVRQALDAPPVVRSPS